MKKDPDFIRLAKKVSECWIQGLRVCVYLAVFTYAKRDAFDFAVSVAETDPNPKTMLSKSSEWNGLGHFISS